MIFLCTCLWIYLLFWIPHLLPCHVYVLSELKYLRYNPFSYPWLYSPLLGLGLFTVSEPYTESVDSLDGGSARRKASTYTQNNTNTE
jgi:hypothetical protein